MARVLTSGQYFFTKLTKPAFYLGDDLYTTNPFADMKLLTICYRASLLVSSSIMSMRTPIAVPLIIMSLPLTVFNF